MKSFFTLLILTVIVMAVGCSQNSTPNFVTDGDYSADRYAALSDSIISTSDFVALSREFMSNAKEMDLLRTVQSAWEEVEDSSAVSFSKTKYENNPNSAENAYLYGRVASSPVEKIELGRKAIELDPAYPYGYRLLTATYSQDLFSGSPADDDYSKLAEMLPADKENFIKFSEVDTTSYPKQVLFNYQIFTEDYEGAAKTLEDAKGADARFPGPNEFATIAAAQGNYKEAKSQIKSMLEGRVDPASLDDYVDYYYGQALRSAHAYDALVKDIKSKKNYSKDPQDLYSIACVYSLKGDKEAAFENLEKAADAGWQMVNHTKDDGDLYLLRDDARWNPIVEKIQSNWDNGYDKRKADILAEMINDPAPTWSLQDVNGNTVSLADLKGQVVVLDFWATWCGPCRMAMPVIDEFTENIKDKPIKVFSINVWEQGIKGKPARFMVANDYDMTLLYGDEQIVKDYGFDGIPFLCVIDKDGQIRFRHSGYTDGLNENLEVWTNELL